MDDSLQNENKLYPKILLCPKCTMRIPSLPLFINYMNENGTIEILLKCDCGNSVRLPLNDYINLKIGKEETINKCFICSTNSPNNDYKYCINCNKYYCNECREIFKESEKDHIFSKRQIFFNCICEKHINHKIEFFCYNCNEILCKKCCKRHANHNIKSLIDYYYELSKRTIDKLKEEIDYKFKINEEEKNEFIKIISNDEIFKNTKKDFELIYEKNKRLNEEILKYIELLYTNFIFSKDFLNYYILCNFDYATRLNKTELTIKDKTNLKKYSKEIINYFKTNYIITFEYFYFFQNIDLIEEKEIVSEIIGINDSLIIYSSSSNLKAYDIKINKQISSISAHSKQITKIIKINNLTDENIVKIASGSEDHLIKIWIYKNFLQLESCLTHENCIINILYNENNLYSITKDQKLYIWNIEKIKNIKIIDSDEPINGIIEFPKNNIIYSKKNILYSLNESKFQKTLGQSRITFLFRINDNSFVSIHEDYNLIFWNEKYQKKKIHNLKQDTHKIGLFTNDILQIILNDFSIHFMNTKTYEIIQFINLSLEKFYTIIVHINNFIISSSINGLKIWIGQKSNPHEINNIIFC